MIGEFYRHVPKERNANLRFRHRLLKVCFESREYQAEVWEMCKRDILFYLNAFCWLLEPRIIEGREHEPDVIPFITYGYQDDAIKRASKVLGKKDIGFHKSRSTGATWLVLYLIDHQIRFHGWRQCGLVSRNMDVVDKPDSQGALMSKLVFANEMLPSFLGGGDCDGQLMMKYLTSNHTITNVLNRGVVTGFPATGNLARGDRLFCVMMDEFHAFDAGDDYLALSASQHATNCRIFISTPDPSKGESGAYYDIISGAANLDMELIEMSWMDDPEKSEGMYTSEDGRLKIIDESYEFPDDYAFILDGKIRSPYYDRECRRPGATERSIAAELDRDFGGATATFYDSQMLDRAKRESVREPLAKGRLSMDEETYDPTWVDSPGGEISLWIAPDMFGQMPRGMDFVIGADVASGRSTEHTSNSVASVFNRRTGEQVAEFVIDTMRPPEFMRACVSLAKFFNDAYLVWDATGQNGGDYTEAYLTDPVAKEYTNVYHELRSHTDRWRQKTMRPGFSANSKVGFGPAHQKFNEALRTSRCAIRSLPLLAECRQYVFKDGKIVHVKSVNTEDESAKKGSHGDRVIAAALAIYVMEVEPVAPKREKKREAESSMETPMGRRKAYLKQLASAESDGWS